MSWPRACPPSPPFPRPLVPHMPILTLLPPQLLSDAQILVKGELELPMWGMLDFRKSEEGDVTGARRGVLGGIRCGRDRCR
ncbi:hypothetical protein HYDPIDRAFT_118525 [Hydnomerulius pinastri MD-312]|uniref:Uncharacterized protein n=1 Tax=Hydnomerulius pinastri MD-312 TaxID=994086 RepID=A0A0C9W9A1_9AGAM|nr:hypothetical protein HYDPIDRAFT_118525 [Hydnomerulius pinastri MD-312]